MSQRKMKNPIKNEQGDVKERRNTRNGSIAQKETLELKYGMTYNVVAAL